MPRALAAALLVLCAAGAVRAQDAGADAPQHALPGWRPAPWARGRADEPRHITSADRCAALVRAVRARDLVHPQRVQISVPDETPPGVAFPVRLTSTIFGVVIGAHGGHRRPRPLVGDCRLFVALAAWTRVLREASISRVGHLSLYRPESCGDPPSGHCGALAIDIAHFVFDDGTDFDVARDWVDRSRGASPCGDRADEPARMTTVRRVVCAASQASMFNVVLTPHYDDDHQNHVHLEVRPGMTGLVLH